MYIKSESKLKSVKIKIVSSEKQMPSLPTQLNVFEAFLLVMWDACLK